MPLAIQTFDLTKTYGANRGIRNINLAIEQGEIFGFLGPNGAGKSTTLRTLLNLMRPTSGRAEIFGTDVHQHPMEVLSRVGSLPTEFTFDRGVTGRKLVRMFADFRGLRRHLVRRRDRRAARCGPRPAHPQTLARQQAEDRDRAGDVPQAGCDRAG